MGGELIPYNNEPIYTSINGIYGYLMVSGIDIFFFHANADGGIEYNNPFGWSLQSGKNFT